VGGRANGRGSVFGGRANGRGSVFGGRAKNSARPRWFCNFNSYAPVLSRALRVASISRSSSYRRFFARRRLHHGVTRNGSKPARLRQAAAEPWARRVLRPTDRGSCVGHSLGAPPRPFLALGLGKRNRFSLESSKGGTLRGYVLPRLAPKASTE